MNEDGLVQNYFNADAAVSSLPSGLLSHWTLPAGEKKSQTYSGVFQIVPVWKESYKPCSVTKTNNPEVAFWPKKPVSHSSY